MPSPPVTPSASTSGSTEEQFRMLVESVRDYAIFMLTPDGRVATWNAGAQAIKGYSAAEIIGSHFSRFYEPEAIARGWPEHELAMARSVGRFEDEGWRLRKDGTRFWASVVITALFDAQHELRGFAKITRDLTFRRKLEDLQMSERRTHEFLALLAHELRNPLAPMRTALDVAERARDDPALQEMTRGILSRQLEHLTRMVDDLLDVGRMTTGKIRLQLEDLDLVQVVREKLIAFQPTFAEQRRSLAFVLPDRPLPVRADATRIAQVIANLLSNALKFTRPGGQVSVSLQHEGNHAMLRVEDDGVGMEPHLIGRAFDAFVQGERGLDRQGGGLGLGLKLVRALVELHGGTVAAASPGLEQGSTFSVTLPVLHSDPARPAPAGGILPARGVPLRVLVVDDSPEIVDSLLLLLRMMGHQVETAYDGVAALQRAPAMLPDVVLLDIGLPRMSGYEVAKALRTLPALQSSLIVACSGYDDASHREESKAAGIDHHLVKPVSAQMLQPIFQEAAARVAARAAVR